MSNQPTKLKYPLAWTSIAAGYREAPPALWTGRRDRSRMGYAREGREISSISMRVRKSGLTKRAITQQFSIEREGRWNGSVQLPLP